MFNTYTQSTTAVTPGLSPALLALNRQQQSIQESSVTYTQFTVVFDPGVQRLLVLKSMLRKTREKNRTLIKVKYKKKKNYE